MSVSTPQISFPLKLSYPIDIDKPIYKYIKHNCSEFYEEERDKANTKSFSDLRGRALHQNIDANKKSTETLAHYYDQLKMLLPKVPILPNNSTANAVRINFTWHNAYDSKRDKVVKQSGHFELLCVLYNLACVKLLIASQANQSEEAELLTAMKNNQAAAGYFDYLAQAMVKTVGTEKVTNDLATASLQSYSAVCLAQAQEMVIKSPKAASMKPLMRAGLSKQCADLYGKARKDLTAALQKPKNSIEICEVKYYYYSAWAELHQANAVAGGPNHGEAIKRCDIAKEYLKNATKKMKNFNGLKELLNTIESSQTQFRKDNDWIYHCGIPNSVDAIPPKAIAKPTPFDEKSFTSTEPIHDIFEAIVPVQIQTALTSFEDKRKRMIGERLVQIQEKNSHMISVVGSLGIDALLDKIFRGQGGANQLPPNIKTAADKVKSSGGFEKLVNDKNCVLNKQQMCKEMINESFNMLNAEAEQDRQNREKFGVNKFDGFNWSAEPSSTANHMLMQELNKYNGILAQSDASNQQVEQKLQTNSAGINILIKDDAAIGQYLGAVTGGGLSALANDPAAQELKNLRKQVEDEKDVRQVIEHRLREEVIINDISAQFLLEFSKSPDHFDPDPISSSVLDNAMSSFDQEIRETADKQDTILRNLERATGQINSSNASGINNMQSANEMQRTQNIGVLTAAFEGFTVLQTNLLEGNKFYDDLTRLVMSTQDKIRDYTMARQMEATSLASTVGEQAASVPATATATTSQPAQTPVAAPRNASTSNTTAPPARPPPPANTTSPTAAPPTQGYVPPGQPTAPIGSGAPAAAPPGVGAAGPYPQQAPAQGLPHYAYGVPGQYPGMMPGQQPGGYPMYGQPMYPPYPMMPYGAVPPAQPGQLGASATLPSQGRHCGPTYPQQGYQPYPGAYGQNPYGQQPQQPK